MPPPRPRPPQPGRAAAAAARRAALAGAAVLAVVLSGCASFDAALGQREIVVQFQPQASSAMRLRVRAACSHIPQVRAEPLPSGSLPASVLNEVRYQVGGASDAEMARLQQCVQRFPAVAGIEFVNPSGN